MMVVQMLLPMVGRKMMLMLFWGLYLLTIQAQEDYLTEKRAVKSDGYPFWIYTPKNYNAYK